MKFTQLAAAISLIATSSAALAVAAPDRMVVSVANYSDGVAISESLAALASWMQADQATSDAITPLPRAGESDASQVLAGIQDTHREWGTL